MIVRSRTLVAALAAVVVLGATTLRPGRVATTTSGGSSQ